MAFNTGALYPLFGIDVLRSQRGSRWTALVDRLGALPGTDERVMAFTLTIRRLRRQGILTQDLCSDPFCALCAARVVEQYAGSEDDLLALYEANLKEIKFVKRHMRVRQPVPVSAVA